MPLWMSGGQDPDLAAFLKTAAPQLENVRAVDGEVGVCSSRIPVGAVPPLPVQPPVWRRRLTDVTNTVPIPSRVLCGLDGHAVRRTASMDNILYRLAVARQQQPKAARTERPVTLQRRATTEWSGSPPATHASAARVVVESHEPSHEPSQPPPPTPAAAAITAARTVHASVAPAAADGKRAAAAGIVQARVMPAAADGKRAAAAVNPKQFGTELTERIDRCGSDTLASASASAPALVTGPSATSPSQLPRRADSAPACEINAATLANLMLHAGHTQPPPYPPAGSSHDAQQIRDSDGATDGAASQERSPLLILDVRPFMSFNRGHLRKSINLSVPAALARRPGFCMGTLESRVCQVDRPAFRNRTGHDIVLYDDDGTQVDRRNHINTLQQAAAQLQAEGQASNVYILADTLERFGELYPHLVQRQSASDPAIQTAGIRATPATATPAAVGERRRNSTPTGLAPGPPGDRRIPPGIAPADMRPLVSLPDDASAYDTAAAFSPSGLLDEPMVSVLPGLFIGDFRAASNAPGLRERGITSVINATSECKNWFQNDPHIRYLQVRLLDTPDERVLVEQIEAACLFIERSLRDGHGVLVHCLAGRSRSATIVLAYLITRRGMTLADAYKFLKAKRPSISPNLGYMGFLLQITPNVRVASP